jgi:hypothetical protein
VLLLLVAAGLEPLQTSLQQQQQQTRLQGMPASRLSSSSRRLLRVRRCMLAGGIVSL